MYLRSVNNEQLLKILNIFINKLIVNIIRCKLDRFLNFTIFYWKKYSNLQFLFFLYEGVLKLRPIIGAYVFIIKRNRMKKKKYILPYVLNKERRIKRALSWLISSIRFRKEHLLLQRVTVELYSLNILSTGKALIYKKAYYKSIIVYKIGKNYLW